MLREQLAAFLARAEAEHGRGLPGFVRRELTRPPARNPRRHPAAKLGRWTPYTSLNHDPAFHSIMKRTLSNLARLSLLLLTACNKGDPLPGGYAVFFGDSEDVGLVLPPKGEILVGPKLAQIGSSGTLIFGEVQSPKKPNPSRVESRTLGFFILDSTTGAIERGLSRDEWSSKLQEAGLQGEPELVHPERKGPRF